MKGHASANFGPNGIRLGEPQENHAGCFRIHPSRPLAAALSAGAKPALNRLGARRRSPGAAAWLGPGSPAPAPPSPRGCRAGSPEPRAMPGEGGPGGGEAKDAMERC